MQSLSPEIIEKKILENYIDYQYLFVEFQSKFMSNLYSRYQSLESGNLVLYFAKRTHQDILRKKDYDLNFNISYERFWKTLNEINPRHRSIIKIADDLYLPKETTRRKILELTEQEVLRKKNRITGWLPDEQLRQNYNLIIEQEINGIFKLLSFVSEKLNHSISREAITKEIKDKFSFYWFHYLETQLEYLKSWSMQLDDLELVFIFLQVARLFTKKAKEKYISHADLYDDPSLIKKFIDKSISVTSISEVTKIPRATCIRKLRLLVKLKMISQDNISKRYYLIPNFASENLISKKRTGEVVKIFSKLFFIFIKAENLKTLN